MKISFDFDGTLSEKPMQDLAKSMVEKGYDVYITTTRHSKPWPGYHYKNDAVFAVADMVGISKEQIRFTEGEDKYKFLKGFNVHFDNDQYEVSMINEHPGCGIGLLFNDKMWLNPYR